MHVQSDGAHSRDEPTWAVVLTPAQLRLLQACVSWHRTMRLSPPLRRCFDEVDARLRDARPIVGLP
jgi:hypothetical protein